MLRLTPSILPDGNFHYENGLLVFRLALWHQGKEVDSLPVNSGARGIQSRANLRVFEDPNSRAGSNEPIPEGEFNVGPPEFAVSNSYSGSWGAGLGPVWFDLSPQRKGNRSAFGIHLDENRAFSPGSAGCIVTPTLEGLKKIVSWWDRYRFSRLVVDHNLGTITGPNPPSNTQQPPAQPPATNTDIKLFFNANGAVISVGETLQPGQYLIVSNGPSWDGKLVRRSNT